MHILLTDISTCPRCGPEHGLILLVEEIEDRRVLRGSLGCPNCRERYAIAGWVGDFRLGEASSFGEPAAAETVVRLVALAGVTSPPGHLLLVGPAAGHAGAASHMVPGVEVIAAGSAADLVDPVAGAVSRVLVSSRLPLTSRRIAGVVLSGLAADALLEEGARVLSPTGRLVLEPAPSDARRRLEAAGLRVLAEQAATMVAVRV